MAFAPNTVAFMRDKMERMAELKKTIAKEHAEDLKAGLHGAVAGGTAFGFGYVNNYYGGEGGEVAIQGIPLDMLVAVAAYGSALYWKKELASYAPLLHGIGTGAATSSAYRWGAKLGAKAHHESRKAPDPSQLGAGLPPSWNLPAGPGAPVMHPGTPGSTTGT